MHDSSSGNAALTAVLLEEIGHYIDARVNSRDAPGDEGEIFARFVQGLQLDPATLQSLRLQNDHATISLRGARRWRSSRRPCSTARFPIGHAANRLDNGASGVANYEAYGRYDPVTGNFEFALSSPVAIGANTTFWLNTDRNLTTGFQVFGFAAGAEYNINFDATGTPLPLHRRGRTDAGHRRPRHLCL